ncbi:MAG: hypothetical protein ACPLYC_01430, partial [Minisyncoccia bacterium]
FPQIYLLLSFIIALLSINTILLITSMREQIKGQWPIVIQSNFLILGSSLFLLFLSQTILYHLFSATFSFFYHSFLNTLYYFLYQPRLYQPYSLEKSSYWLTFITLFCFVAELNALSVFYNLPNQLTPLPLFILCYWFYFYLLRINKIEFESKTEIIFTFSLILTELYFVFSFLPINFHLIGLILAGFYVIIFKLWLSKQKLTLPMAMSNQKK